MEVVAGNLEERFMSQNIQELQDFASPKMKEFRTNQNVYDKEPSFILHLSQSREIELNILHPHMS